MGDNVDVYVSPEEVLLDKRKSCLRIDADLLQPAVCLSGLGRSTGGFFKRPGSARAPEYGTTSSATPGDRSLWQVASAFQKQNMADVLLEGVMGTDVDNTTALTVTARDVDTVRDRSMPLATSSLDEAGPMPGSHAAQMAAQVDDMQGCTSPQSFSLRKLVENAEKMQHEVVEKEIKKRAVREARAKYLTPRLAAKYGVSSAPTNGRPVGVSLLPTQSVIAAISGVQQDLLSQSKAGEMVSAAQKTINARSRSASLVGTAAPDGSGSPGSVRGAGAHPPRVQSARKKAVSYGTSSFASSVDRTQALHATKLSPGMDVVHGPGKYSPKYALQTVHVPGVKLARPSSAPVRRPASASGPAAKGSGGGGSPKCDEAPASPSHQPDHQDRMSEAGHSEGSAGGGGEKTVLPGKRVHPRPVSAPGSSTFKAVGREKAAAPETAAAHLGSQYYYDGYDDLAKKMAIKGTTRIGRQPPRPPPHNITDCPATLGPGSYLHSNLPQTMTGRHVQAGHDPRQKVPGFSKYTARPGSAPPARPAPGPVPPVPVMEPSEMQQEQSAPYADDYFFGAAVLALAEKEWQQKPRVAGAARPPSAPAFGRSTSLGPGHYLGPAELSKVTSSGLASHPKGGMFSLSTRAAGNKAIRAYQVNHVVPPASAPGRTCEGGELKYDPNHEVEAHRARAPSWALPPNRAALSKKWLEAATSVWLTQPTL